MKLITNRGKVHQKILNMLSSGDWVYGKNILQETGQSYYDRRIRELRDEEGWKIVTESRGATSRYRLISFEKGKSKRRHYIGQKKRKMIYERDDYKCQICGIDLNPETGKTNPQIDHKIPLIKDGSAEDQNLQTLCNECNVIKRGACHRCTKISCANCVYAFPENYRNRVILDLNEPSYKALEEIAKKEGKGSPEVAAEIIYRWLRKKTS